MSGGIRALREYLLQPDIILKVRKLEDPNVLSTEEKKLFISSYEDYEFKNTYLDNIYKTFSKTLKIKTSS